MSEHVCNLSDPWPTGHPLPEEDPAKLTGPLVGQAVTYRRTRRHRQGDTHHVEVAELPAVVKARSYVWSPGECRHKGGYRHYDWTVITVFPEGEPSYTVVVDDEELS